MNVQVFDLPSILLHSLVSFHYFHFDKASAFPNEKNCINKRRANAPLVTDSGTQSGRLGQVGEWSSAGPR